jgi:DNA-3-methyladenine glycosylase
MHDSDALRIKESQQQLPESFYLDSDVCGIARALLGKVLWCSGPEGLKALVIAETEAYEGETDRASHAWGGRRTARTETMYRRGGHAYVYLCYGIHWLFNAVTADEGVPHAVLVRGGIPLESIHAASDYKEWKKLLVSGPGRVTKYLGINGTYNGIWMQGAERVCISDSGIVVNPKHVVRTPRIGVDYAGEHAAWLYRFVWEPATE